MSPMGKLLGKADLRREALALPILVASSLLRILAEGLRYVGADRAALFRWLRWAPLGLLAVPLANFLATAVLFERLGRSIPLRPPSKRQRAEVDEQCNPLIRAFPALARKFAWRPLGIFPTPVHRFAVSLAHEGAEGEAVEFWAKREDLVSESYGGNKVRTLQYVLGAFEACVEEDGAGLPAKPRLLTLGSGGSNLVVAAKVHAAACGLNPSVASIEGLTPFPDLPEMDNTLNYLSSLSLPGSQALFDAGWLPILRAAFQRRSGSAATWPWVLPPGGNCPPGVLGQVGAALELAEQIERGEAPDPDGLVLALGSSCTAAGLCLGVAAARASGRAAFRRPGFRIFVQPVHPLLLLLQKRFGFYFSRWHPSAICRNIRDVAAAIAERGGPDLAEAAVAVMRQEMEITAFSDIVGDYGAHSAISLEALKTYKRSAKGPGGSPGLWLCGHFTAKSFALMLRLLREDAAAQRPPRRLIYWASKSVVQPLGAEDEWAAFDAQRRRCAALRSWGVLGGVSGHPGGDEGGEAGEAQGPGQYRPMMTRLA